MQRRSHPTEAKIVDLRLESGDTSLSQPDEPMDLPGTAIAREDPLREKEGKPRTTKGYPGNMQ